MAIPGFFPAFVSPYGLSTSGIVFGCPTLGAGLPPSLTQFTISFWYCGGVSRIVANNNPVTNLTGGLVINAYTSGIATPPGAGANFAEVVFTAPGGISLTYVLNNRPIYDQTSDGTRYRCRDQTHFMISVNVATHTIQVYANNAPLTYVSGSWGSATSIANAALEWAFHVRNLEEVADLWIVPVALDLSVSANRLKFTNVDLSAVDLPSNGAVTISESEITPVVFLHAMFIDTSAAPFLSNRGTGPDWATISPTGGPPMLSGYGLGTTSPCMTLTLLQPITDSELVLGPVNTFMDLSVEVNRRQFISPDGTPAWMGEHGELPFDDRPAVYLTTLGPPFDFTTNNGTGGTFQVHGTVGPHDGPGCSTYTIIEVIGQSPSSGWRLSVSDDGGVTWSRLVKPRDVGLEGDYLRRLRWLKMGNSRERVLKLECTDHVRRNIIGVYIDADTGMG